VLDGGGRGRKGKPAERERVRLGPAGREDHGARGRADERADRRARILDEPARLAAEAGKGLVIGTTGFGPEDERAIAEAAARAPIVKAPNMSLAVNLLMALTERVSATLGPDYDIEIFEIHHRHKIDAPSGTALGLGQAAARGRGVDLASHGVRARDGHTGPRKEGTIGFSVARGGGEVGDHSVMFCGAADRIELVHKAHGRGIYASGAVRAALWLAGRKPGLYGMKDVLGL
jgi:4-hydroxy-tetrahydrodipicolinate reductase